MSNSNASIPPGSPVTAQVPPLPTTTRGEPCPLDGTAHLGRITAGKSILAYPSGKLCVVRSLTGDALPNSDDSVLVYRGHMAATSCVAISTSGAYVASGDVRGKIRVWALDHEEHLCKLDTQGLTSSVLAISWDGESKRLAFAGERADGRSECTRAIQWDTGVTQGTLSQHVKGRSSAIAFRPARPFRIATGGKEDSKCHLHKGPPFQKITVENGVPNESAHSKGVNCMVYTSGGELLASVGGDKSICIYEGKTMELLTKKDDVHSGTIYACAWSGDNKQLLTASADGTCKLFDVAADGKLVNEVHVWHVAKTQFSKSAEFDKTPRGGMQLGCAFVNGTTPVSVSTNNQLAILPMPGTSGDIEIVTGHNAPIGAVAFDHVNSVFYTGDSDGIMCKWEMGKEKAITAKHRIEPADNAELMYQVHGGAISGMSILADGRLVSVGWDDTAYFTSAKGVLEAENINIPAQPTTVATGTKLTAIVTVSGVFLLRDGKSASGGLMPLDYTANAVCVSKDDKTVFIGGDDCQIHVYNVTGNELQQKHVISDGHLKPVHALALSNNGTMLAAADVRDVCVYDLSDNFKVLVGKSRWCFHLQRITTLSWSPDDKVIASGGQDDSIYLWCLDKKSRRLHYPYAHRGGVIGVSFRTDANLQLVSVGADSCVVQWDMSKDVQEKFT